MQVSLKTKTILFAALAIVVIVAALFVINKTPDTPEKSETSVVLPSAPEPDTLQNKQDIAEVAPKLAHVNSYELYEADPVTLFDKSKLVFISVSDRYEFNDHPDSLNIPGEAFKGKKAGDAPHILLEGIYRKRLMAGTGIKESDSLFVYNYSKDRVTSYSIHDLKTSAVINGYSSEDEDVEQYYYQIGFELPKSEVRKFEILVDHGNLVYIGTKNIFTKGQVKPIRWTDTDTKIFPAHNCTAPEKQEMKGDKNNVFEYIQDGYHYYVQDGQQDSTMEGYSENRLRHLLITDSTNNVVTDLYIKDSESSSPATLNDFSKSKEGNWISQYTGKLFKDKPPVIFGLTWASFGCEDIQFLSPSEPFIYINCDNRH